MARKLRIAVSVFFGVLTVALVVLWVRSYSMVDIVHSPITHTQGVWCASNGGQIIFALTEVVTPGFRPSWVKFDTQSRRAESEREEGEFGFVGGRFDYWTVWGPHWTLVIVACSVAVVTWIPSASRRFSLRTLLIATTLFAVVLGLAVWAGR